MDNVIALEKKLLPDLLEVMRKRYHVLQYLRLMGPIGRRGLAANLGMTERVVRREVEFLSKQGLVSTTAHGMTLTVEGEKLLDGLEETMKEVSGLSELEQALEKRLNLHEVIVVPGDSDKAPWVKKDMGRACLARMNRELAEENVIAVAGGTTLAAVAELMRPIGGAKSALFVPARGGLGERVENQANTICAEMARKAEGAYRLLHVPDQLSSGSFDSLVEEPGVKEVLGLIRSAGIVIHGIGEARTMAKRRKSSPELLEKIEREKAVAEAFGYYFDGAGNIVHKVKTIGLQLEDLQTRKAVLTVAGGASKAGAIAAYFKRSPESVLITDEGAAMELAK
ncbi:MAG TPA: sugar-binding domain-containing protein [Bacillales bacterium]|nr:sugar-binding domain-containing protein [Bacillales bacterium]